MWGSVPFLALAVLMYCSHTATAGPSRHRRSPVLAHHTGQSGIKPTIRSFHVTSNIKNRYATTLVSTQVVNQADQSREAKFTVTLPESAFISQFLMEVNDTVYKAYVKEKEEAVAIYKKAAQSGKLAGHVDLDARDSNRITVSVNVEAQGKVTFNLTYEQLLPRELGVYSNVINIDPQQIVEDFSVIVDIEEPTAIVKLEVPELQMSNEVVPNKRNRYADIEEISSTHKRIIWAPTPEEQEKIRSGGVRGQLIVKYDVDRDYDKQQILLNGGYFVHFFAPDGLMKIKRHVVFVLDFSSSMRGRKLSQLKDAMDKILDDLRPEDDFSIVIFHSWMVVWSPTGSVSIGVCRKCQRSFPNEIKYIVGATAENIRSAKSFLRGYNELHATNIMGGLRLGLQLVDQGANRFVSGTPPEPMIIFLTDGLPNREIRSPDAIIAKTKTLNTKTAPIFSLSFGYDADFNFLRKLSLQNSGFARIIYVASDASRQLENFYQTIASPLLTDVKFSYLPEQVDSSYITNREFPAYYEKSELVVAGRVAASNPGESIGELQGRSSSGTRTYSVVTSGESSQGTGNLEKVWAYLTIRQLLDKAESLNNGEEKRETRKKALDLALQYSFVTPLTSLVVVKPTETECVDMTQVKPGSQKEQRREKAANPSRVTDPVYDLDIRFGEIEESPSTTPETVSSSSESEEFSYPGQNLETHREEEDTTALHRVQSQPPRSLSLEDIKWLRTPVSSRGANKTVVVGGHRYRIGINETNSTFGHCEVNGSRGECRHIQHCALEIFQNSILSFLPYRCNISGNYLGVCCPENVLV